MGKPKQKKGQVIQEATDPFVKLLSYLGILGKVNKKQREDRIGILKTLEASTNMGKEDLDSFLSYTVDKSLEHYKDTQEKANKKRKEEYEIYEMQELPPGLKVIKGRKI
jgi:hypothetical protein